MSADDACSEEECAEFVRALAKLGVLGRVRAIADDHLTTLHDIRGRGRTRLVSRARAAAVLAVFENDRRELTLDYVGKIFGRHHSSILKMRQKGAA